MTDLQAQAKEVADESMVRNAVATVDIGVAGGCLGGETTVVVAHEGGATG